MNNKDIVEQGKTRFPSTNQPPAKSKSGPKQFLKQFGKQNRISKEDIRTFAKNILFEKSIEEIESYCKETKGEIPAFIWGLSICFIKDCSRGRVATLAWLIELIYGKPDQNINLNPGKDVTELTPEERACKS